MQAVGRSHQGIRSRNEDVYMVRSDINFVGVCDGMGGAPGGAIAARLAIDEVSDILETCETSEAITEPVFCDAIHRANDVVHSRGQTNVDLLGMGSTLVSAVFKGNRVLIGHVGDSRAYLFHDKTLNQITRDDSRVQDLIDAGELDPAKREEVAFKSVLTQAIGPDATIEPHVKEIEMVKNDRLVLCSDGVCGFIEESEISEIVDANGHNLMFCLNALVQTAIKRGSTDNITAVVARLAT